MKPLWYLSFIVSVVCAVARSAPPEGAIVVAKSGGDFDSVGPRLLDTKMIAC